MPWWSSRPAPEGWSPAEQVARVGLPGQVSGSPVAQYVQVRDDGTVDVRLGPRWAIFNEALADAVTSLPPRGSPERRLSTYWIDQTLSRLAAFRHGGEGGVVASGNAYSISVSENHVTAMWDYGDADTSERMTIAEFVEILEGCVSNPKRKGCNVVKREAPFVFIWE